MAPELPGRAPLSVPSWAPGLRALPAVGQGWCCPLNSPGLIPAHHTLLAALLGTLSVTTASKVPGNH